MANAQQELERGRQAAEVLDNPAFQDAMAQIQTEIVSRWQAEKDERQREWLWNLAQSSKRLQKLLTDTMQTGQLRAKSLEMERSRAEKVGATLRRAFAR